MIDGSRIGKNIRQNVKAVENHGRFWERKFYLGYSKPAKV
jgi:hypothetical protein